MWTIVVLLATTQLGWCSGFAIPPRFFALPITKANEKIKLNSLRMSTLPEFEAAIDLSPCKNRSVLKIITKQGDESFPCAQDFDRVVLKWTVFDLEGRKLHSTEVHPMKIFEFLIHRAQSEVVPAWELVARSMYKGEQATVFAASETAFGSAGAPPSIPPNTDLICEFKMVDILYQSVSGISTLQEGEDLFSSASAKVRESWVRDNEEWNRNSAQRRGEQFARKTLGNKNSFREAFMGQNNSPNNTFIDPSRSPRFFDPSKHQLDPNREIFGSSLGHRWKETAETIEVHILLPPTTTKRDLQVEVQKNQIKVQTKAFSIQGKLMGKVAVSSSSWAVVADEERKYLQIVFDKLHEYRDLWASFFMEDSIRDLQQDVSIEAFEW